MVTPPRIVLITGANGFLGSHLVRGALGAGYTVHAYVRGNCSLARLADVTAEVTQWHGELNDVDMIAKVCRESRAEVVFHCAGDTSGRRFEGDWTAVTRAMQVNLHGTLALLEGAAQPGSRVASVIRIGGLEEYGLAPTPWSEEMREEPSSPYSASQVAATHAVRALQPQLSFAVVTLRPALIYGPSQSLDFLIPALITALLRGERFAITDGQQHRDLLYIDDFVEAALLAAARPGLRGSVINISTAVEWQVAEVALRIARRLGAELSLDIGARPARAGELQHLVANNTRAAEFLGWRPTTGLDEGLRRTVEWYQQHLQEELPR